jgi:hypothetical protein
MDSDFGVILVALVAAGVIRWYLGRLDRTRIRIRKHVSQHGGNVLDILWSPLGTGWPATSNARLYTVRYTTRGGEIVKATCATSLWSGVHWIREAPPDVSEPRAIQAAPAVTPEEIQRTLLFAPAELITCLQCGRKIPASETRCSNCGWSYQAG